VRTTRSSATPLGGSHLRYSDESSNLRVEIDAKQFEPSPEGARRVQDGLSLLGKLVEELPVSDLCVTIFRHPRGGPGWRLRQILLGRLATPEDVAAAVPFLASDAAYVTGSTYFADGGLTWFYEE
jgi:hypothetical protein